MKYKILITIITFATINAANIYAMPVRDTLPEIKKVNTTDTTIENSEITDLENELDEINGKDTTKIRVGNLKIAVIDDGDDVIINRSDKDNEDWDDWGEWDNDNKNYRLSTGLNKNFKPHWAGFAMGLNNYMTSDFSTTLPDTASYLEVNTNISYEVVLNILQLGIPVVKDRIGFATGVGFKWNNYKFNDPQVRLFSKTDTANYLQYEIDTVDSYVKSKLTVSYLIIPLLLEFQIPIQDHSLYLSGGVEAGLKLGSHTKMKTTSGSKTKDKSDFHVSPYTLAVVARLGYGAFGVYGTYSLQTLFKEGKGPELYPFAVGVSINF